MSFVGASLAAIANLINTHSAAAAPHSGHAASAHAHAHSALSGIDTDTATTALHHTIGAGAAQSAAGNHDHAAAYAAIGHNHDATYAKGGNLRIQSTTISLPACSANTVNDQTVTWPTAFSGAPVATATLQGDNGASTNAGITLTWGTTTTTGGTLHVSTVNAFGAGQYAVHILALGAG